MPRKTEYTEELAVHICERISDGESLRKICLDEDMPDKATVLRWLASEAHATFRDQYAYAREAQADFYAESTVDIADEEVTMIKKSKHSGGKDEDAGDEEIEVVFDPTAVARNRLRVDARKWYASKLAPKKYGDKLAIGGADDLPAVQIEKIERVIVRPKN